MKQSFPNYFLIIHCVESTVEQDAPSDWVLSDVGPYPCKPDEIPTLFIRKPSPISSYNYYRYDRGIKEHWKFSLAEISAWKKLGALRVLTKSEKQVLDILQVV